jgi:hypothetical protein
LELLIGKINLFSQALDNKEAFEDNFKRNFDFIVIQPAKEHFQNDQVDNWVSLL